MPKNDDGVPITIRTEVDPQYLKERFNKLNWKQHTKRQKEYVASLIQDNGWVKSVIYCANTDRLLDGHGRIGIAIDEKRTTIPVDIGYWTKEQGDQILASLDPTSNMASIDSAALKSLAKSNLSKLKELNPKSRLLSLHKDLYGHANAIEEGTKDKIGIRQSKLSANKISKLKNVRKEDKKDKVEIDDDNITETILRDDVIFKTMNKLGLPSLKSDMLYRNTKVLPEDTFCRDNTSLLASDYYCETSRPFDGQKHMKPKGGFLGFFTEDHKFEKYYTKAPDYVSKLLAEEWTAVCEPDFSTYYDWPFAKRLWSVYKARWCARYWQEAGLKVIPLIHRTNNLERDKWMYTSLPESTPIGIMQLRMGGTKLAKDTKYWESVEAILTFCIKNIKLRTILFYSTPNYEKYVTGYIPNGLNYRFITPFIQKYRKSTK
jgi:hypothetical protein